MSRIGGKSQTWWVLLVMSMVLFPSILTWGQEPSRTPHDYFMQPPNSKLRTWAVKYHLNRNKFFAQLKAGHYQSALGELLIVLDYLPNHPKALALLNTAAPLAGKPAMVDYRYERAIHLYPQHAFTYAQFGMYVADKGQMKRGIALLKKAITLDPKNGTFQAWLAQVYGKAGKADLARQAAQKAKELGYRKPRGVKGAKK